MSFHHCYLGYLTCVLLTFMLAIKFNTIIYSYLSRFNQPSISNLFLSIQNRPWGFGVLGFWGFGGGGVY